MRVHKTACMIYKRHENTWNFNDASTTSPKKNEIHTSHWCNFMGWNDNPGCPRSKETMYPSWMIPKIPMASYLSVRERLWSSNRGGRMMDRWIQGSKFLGTFFSPGNQHGNGKSKISRCISYCQKVDFPLPCSCSGV